MNIRTKVKTVAVFGAGAMGTGIAQVFAQNGRSVLLQDALPGAVEKSIGSIDKVLKKPLAEAEVIAFIEAAKG